jgi:hypothetical protein
VSPVKYELGFYIPEDDFFIVIAAKKKNSNLTFRQAHSNQTKKVVFIRTALPSLIPSMGHIRHSVNVVHCKSISHYHATTKSSTVVPNIHFWLYFFQNPINLH